jgi:uncharacterized membrane protein YkoI
MADAARELICYSAAETRDKIVTHGLFDPFRILRSAAGSLQAEAIGVKLCFSRDDLVYDISLLEPEGSVIHVLFNAKTGAIVEPQDGR